MWIIPLAPPNALKNHLYEMDSIHCTAGNLSDYDIRKEISDFYKDYYGYELSDEQLDSLLRLDLNK